MDRNEFKSNEKKEDNNPLEIPENSPAGETRPIKNKWRVSLKAAYAFAFLIALGAALFAKVSSEKALGELKVPIESDYIEETYQSVTSKDKIHLSTEPDFEVRQNLENEPDTREPSETAEISETAEASEDEKKEKYAMPYKDYFVLPLGTEIQKDYSPDKMSYNATMDDWRTHNGIDFKGAEGEAVKAIAYGTVTDVYSDALLGTVIEIDHGNEVKARYCGFNEDTVEVKRGATVKSGMLLGYLGVVPCEKTEISHLHFEIYYKNKNVDPLELMGK